MNSIGTHRTFSSASCFFVRLGGGGGTGAVPAFFGGGAGLAILTKPSVDGGVKVFVLVNILLYPRAPCKADAGALLSWVLSSGGNIRSEFFRVYASLTPSAGFNSHPELMRSVAEHT